jgi:hypothetical protein
MEHRSVRYAIRMGIASGQWSVAIYPAGEVLERLATSDKTTIVIERQPDGKMRVASGS